MGNITYNYPPPLNKQIKPTIIETEKYIEVIGHYNNEVQCAKMTLLAELYAIEHREGYAKFPLNIADKLELVDNGLAFPAPPEPPQDYQVQRVQLKLVSPVEHKICLVCETNYGAYSTVEAGQTDGGVSNDVGAGGFSSRAYLVEGDWRPSHKEELEHYRVKSIEAVPPIEFSYDNGVINLPNTNILGGDSATVTITVELEKLEPTNITLDLSTIGLSEGAHSIQMKLSDDGVTKADSALSNVVSYTSPEQNTVTLTNTASGGSPGTIYFECNLYEGEYDDTKDAIAVINKNETVSLHLENGLYTLLLPGIVSANILESSGDIVRDGGQFTVSGSGSISFYAGARF